MSIKNLHNDTDLLAQLKKGHAGAFKIIFDQYWDLVYAICFKHLGSHEDAKELTQEIFKSLWERRAKLDPSGSLKHYLAKAAKFQVYNFFRNQNTSKRHMDNFFKDQSFAENATENEINYRQLKEQLNYLIGQLPTQCKTVFHLSRVSDLSHKQIAEQLNISVKTVEYHLGNARKYLAKELRVFSR
ncbi:MAG: RNA polymerase sigma-70 factor [Cytophagales bacterium]|nr:RNA polymerase sigma-70 factor [Cytophagales bacterium]